MASIGDVAAALRTVLGMLEESRTNAKAADDRLEDVQESLQADLAGTSNPLAHEGLSQLGAARERLAEALSLLVSGTERMGEYVASIAGGPSRGGGGAPPLPPQSSGEPSPLPDFKPRRIHPEAREAIRRAGWPQNQHGDIAARGQLYDREGQPLLGGKTLAASKTGPGADTSDLKEPWRSDDRYKTRYHIEGHTAAYMRRNNVTEAVLYLNIPPCGNRDSTEPDPIRCEANLTAHLPQGSVLYVHSVHENGTTRSKPYSGTGEALA